MLHYEKKPKQHKFSRNTSDIRYQDRIILNFNLKKGTCTPFGLVSLCLNEAKQIMARLNSNVSISRQLENVFGENIFLTSSDKLLKVENEALLVDSM